MTAVQNRFLASYFLPPIYTERVTDNPAKIVTFYSRSFLVTLQHMYPKQDEMAFAFVTQGRPQLIGSIETSYKLLSMQVSQSGGLSRL